MRLRLRRAGQGVRRPLRGDHDSRHLRGHRHRRRGHRCWGHRHRGSYRRHRRRRHLDGHRRLHRDHDLQGRAGRHRGRAGSRRDDRQERDGIHPGAGAYCPATCRAAGRPDGVPADAEPAARPASATRTGCCRRAGSARRAWVRRGRAPAEGWEYRAWHLGPPRVRSRQEALPAPRALRPPPEPPRAAAGRARQASGPLAWVAHWPRWHRCRQRLAWPVRLHHCLPPSRVCYRRTLRATGARRALRRLTTLI
jgi:hypothetical protein